VRPTSDSASPRTGPDGSPPASTARRPFRPIGWAGLALATLVLAGCGRAPAPPEPVRSVRTLLVGTESVDRTREHAAVVRARTETRLSFRVAGKLLERRVEVGQTVKAGQLLAVLDPADLRLGQQAATAAVQAAAVNAEQARADLVRFKELRSQGFISDAELQRRQTAADAADAQWAQAKAQAEVQRNQAAYSQLLAPAAGVVTAIDAEPGMVLAAGTPVLRLAHAGPRDAVFVVPETAVDDLRRLKGQRGAVTVRLWGREEPVPATVTEVAAAADAVTRSFQVKADLGEATADLGQTASVRLPRPAARDVVRLPMSAVRAHDGGSAVWLLDGASMTVHLTPVQVSGLDGEHVLVGGGLPAGAEVVTAGVHVLSEGQKVTRYVPAGSLPASAAAR